MIKIAVCGAAGRMGQRIIVAANSRGPLTTTNAFQTMPIPAPMSAAEN